MGSPKLIRIFFLCACYSGLVASSEAINISLQFAPGTLFYPGIDGTAKATINQAAQDVSDAITSTLNGINQDSYGGSYFGTSAAFDWNYQYSNPSTGAQTTIENIVTPENTVTIFVGTRSFVGTTLGTGGPSGIGFSVNINSLTNAQQALDAAAANSEAALLRGSGPVIGTVGGVLDFGAGNVFNTSIQYGLAYGSLSLDYDEDNNGVIDTPAELDNYWHWNYNTPVASGKNDLYSIALHEILHAVGIGASESWDALTSGTTWNGSEVQALAGTGANLVTPPGNHIASDVMSTRISDGMPQEVVMDPDLATGTRKELTALDLAFLRDIGYETISPMLFDSADYDTDGDVDASDLAILRNWYGTNANADADGDGDTDGTDTLIWQRQYNGTINTVVASVPEPTSVAMLAMGLFAAMSRRLP